VDASSSTGGETKADEAHGLFAGRLSTSVGGDPLLTAVDVGFSKPVNRTSVQLLDRLTARFPVAEPLRLHEQQEMLAIVQCHELCLTSHAGGVEQDRAHDLSITLILNHLA
jgi:hypothetical protein